MRTLIAALLLAAATAAAAAAAPAAAGEVGDDGLHKEPWFALTFKDMAEDLAAARAEGKRLAVIFEQRGCIYCRELHEVLADPEVAGYVADHYMVVQMNLYGDEEVTDFDGVALPEKKMARRWGVVFTPTVLFMPDTLPEAGTAGEAAVSVMPGAFHKDTTLHMFEWVVAKGYEGDEHFQSYHARRLAEQQ